MAKLKKKSIFSSTGFNFLTVVAVSTVLVLTISSIQKNSSTNRVLGASTIADAAEGQQTQGQNYQHENYQPSDLQQNGNLGEGGNPPVPLYRVNFETQNHERFMPGENNPEIEISSDGGHLNIRAKNRNGQETQLNDNSLNQINESLKSEGLEIATTDGGFLLKQGTFSAKTHFPLSINTTNNELTVTTPAGTKTVAVLPDQAVENLIRQKFISVVASSSADTGISLDVYASQSAFMINGILHKNLFGFFPVNINRTAVVSAENGQLLQTNESFINKLLDLLSIPS